LVALGQGAIARATILPSLACARSVLSLLCYADRILLRLGAATRSGLHSGSSSSHSEKRQQRGVSAQ